MNSIQPSSIFLVKRQRWRNRDFPIPWPWFHQFKEANVQTTCRNCNFAVSDLIYCNHVYSFPGHKSMVTDMISIVSGKRYHCEVNVVGPFLCMNSVHTRYLFSLFKKASWCDEDVMKWSGLSHFNLLKTSLQQNTISTYYLFGHDLTTGWNLKMMHVLFS